MEQKPWLAYFMKGMWFGCEQPFLQGEHWVTSQKTAAKDTSRNIAICQKFKKYSKDLLTH